jgi:hypothetical protein
VSKSDTWTTGTFKGFVSGLNAIRLLVLLLRMVYKYLKPTDFERRPYAVIKASACCFRFNAGICEKVDHLLSYCVASFVGIFLFVVFCWEAIKALHVVSFNYSIHISRFGIKCILIN